MNRSIAIYERVSTAVQSVEMQDTDLKQYCEQRKLTIYDVYIDNGVSGAKDRRPALDRLMADARKRKFDVVLVWRFDRLARSTKHLISALEEFNHLGIDFISYQEQIDTGSPLGKAVFVIVSAIAELERSLIVERVRAGLSAARARGVPIGRPSVLGGQVSERILCMKDEGTSIRAIARELGISKSAVHKALHKSVMKPCVIS